MRLAGALVLVLLAVVPVAAAPPDTLPASWLLDQVKTLAAPEMEGSGPVLAQETRPAGEGFRVEAEPDTLGRRGPAVVGWLYNDQGVGFTNVRIRVDVLDGDGQTVGTGEAYVYGNLPARGRSYFFVPVSRFGAGYRVTVIRFDRLEMQ